jgi:transcriptional regulator with XRE-family HTH domain
LTPLEFKLWRVARGLNQREAAHLFGVSQAAVSHWERLKPVVQVRPSVTDPAVPEWVAALIRLFDVHNDVPEDETEGQWADRMVGPDSGCIE